MKMLFEIFLIVALLVILCVIDWGVTVWTLYIACKFLLWEFSLSKATGVWLLLMLIRQPVGINRRQKD